MLRLQNREFINQDQMVICEKSLIMNESIWQNCINTLNDKEQFIPIKNTNGELLAYGFQDHEANRELRMLKELRSCKDALQFADVFPDYSEVVIYGCNELAVSFAGYLEESGITVSVIGKYWNYFGFTSCNEISLLEVGRGEKLIVYAEKMPYQNNSIADKMKVSVSSEFECIDVIYEANVLKEKITDKTGTFAEFIKKLKDEQEIVILGDGRGAQDTYDLLMKYGIDICSFGVTGQTDGRLLGKPVVNVCEAMKCFQSPVFLNCKDIHSTLGDEWTEYFDYRGYERNKRYFLVKDYTDIPDSNLIHVLHGKRVLLTGDVQLCQLLSDYLYRIEDGEVTVKYIPLSEKQPIEKEDILCLVIPDYYNRVTGLKEKRREILEHQLSDMGFLYYTSYFISSRAFVLIDAYLNHGTEKYAALQLLPKGILIGRIPCYSGNVFFRGVMDGHPEVLMMPYSELNENLFYYCIRLAHLDADEILCRFWDMFDEEAGNRERYFNCEKFETSVKRFLKYKQRFTSQELFILFHAAYAEMVSDKQVSDLSQLIIYWEPHFVPRNEFAFFALWLEDKKINGQTIVLRRDNIVRTGSQCARAEAGKLPVSNVFTMMFLDETIYDGVHLQFSYWKEFKMRFEDIKLKPREKLTEICERFDIGWSDSMMKTTRMGKVSQYRGSVDFDLKAVFNKYEDYLTEFDRFRIAIASSPYQKRYGFSSENCLKFTRRELQELFLKPFLFEEKIGSKEDLIEKNEWVAWQLWKVRKHFVLEDVPPEMERFEVEQTGTKRLEENNQYLRRKSIEFAKSHDKLILYGTGRDCLGLLEALDIDLKQRFLYSDRRAETQKYTFMGKTVIAPNELCKKYKDYNILVTSSLYRVSVECELNKLGIESSRIFYNEAKFS